MQTLVLRIPHLIWYAGIMAKIPLFGKLGLGKYALVDDEDVERVAGTKWHVSDSGYAVNRYKGKTLRMHRLINETPDGLVTDHINHNRLDNRKKNLRAVTQKENVRNCSGRKHSVYKDLPIFTTYDKHRNSYVVRKPYWVSAHGRIVARHFRTLEEAKKYLNTWIGEVRRVTN